MRSWGLGMLCVVVGLGLGCGEDPTVDPDAGDDAGGLCAADEQCDDGLFCSGVERCAPGDARADARGCVSEETCMPTQRCIEAERRCVTSCAVAPDADGDGVPAIECGGTDCDDASASRFPGNVEVCDPFDVDEDCDATTFGDRDADGDGFVDAACCNGPLCGDDCDDRRRDVHPGQAEVCDDRDNDCDAAVDEGVLVMGWADEDLDLHGDASRPTLACPGTPRFATVSDDCDDADPMRHGAQLEICDGVDNDCDEEVDESPSQVPWYADDDGDGFGAEDASRVVVSCTPVAGHVLRGRDCDDTDPDVSPAARERCNGRDDDCNGVADHRTDDGDGEDDDGDGVADRVCGGSDCDDARAYVHPGAPELCNGLDDDCDGIADGATEDALWYLDRDGDGWGDAADDAPLVQCAPAPARVTRAGDCDDGDSSVHPARPDRCGGGDEDCDVRIDEDGPQRPFYRDGDGDGFGTAAEIDFACAPPPGFVARAGDLDDSDAVRFPTAVEICDGIDDDLDGRIDEELASAFYRDADGDGFGDAGGAASSGCAPPAPTGWAPTNDDCDDTRAGAYPGASELCDARDQDCDGAIDEGAATSCVVFGGVGACTAGACAIASCAAGRDDCDAAYATGCETSTSTSASHCGGCGLACGLGDTCGRDVAGTCDAAPISALAGGGGSSFGPFFGALRASGGLLTWGTNSYGQAGTGVSGGIPRAVPLGDIAQVSTGANHACARVRDGRVYCWGYGDEGQIGDGGGGSRFAPSRVLGITDAIDVAAGEILSCAVLATGRVRCWGRWTATRQFSPVEIPDVEDALAVSVGSGFGCAMRTVSGGGREVWCWGLDEGLGTCGGGCSATPRRVAGLPSDLVAFGRGWARHTCVITGEGAALCWGRGYELGITGCAGSCGVGTPISPVGMTSGVVAIAQSVGIDCAVRRTATDSRELWCWGDSDLIAQSGAYGNGTQPTAARTPIRAAAALSDVHAVAVGSRGTNQGTTCVLRGDGQVYCFGGNPEGALGDDGCGTARADPTRPELAVCGIP